MAAIGYCMLKLEDFFGLAIDEERLDILPLMALIHIEDEIKKTNVVKTLSKQYGADASIVSVARRQQVLKLIKPLLNEKMLDYEASYYTKEISTSSDFDRKYDAEEHLLDYALIVASTKSKKMLAADPGILNSKQLREAAFLESRFDRCWEILSKETHHIVSAFRKSKK